MWRRAFAVISQRRYSLEMDTLYHKRSRRCIFGIGWLAGLCAAMEPLSWQDSRVSHQSLQSHNWLDRGRQRLTGYA